MALGKPAHRHMQLRSVPGLSPKFGYSMLCVRLPASWCLQPVLPRLLHLQTLLEVQGQEQRIQALVKHGDAALVLALFNVQQCQGLSSQWLSTVK